MNSQDGPLARAALLTGLDAMVAEAGGDLRLLMAECGLPVLALSKFDLLISYRRFHALLEIVAQRLEMPNLGIEWTKRMAPYHADMGPLVALAHSAVDVAEWFADARVYWAGHNNAVTMEFIPEVRPGVSVLRENNNLPGPNSRQASEKILASTVAILREGTGLPDLSPVRVRFCHGRPRDISVHEAFFRCPVEFGCDDAGVEIPTEYFALPTAAADEPMRAVVRKYVQHRVDALEVYDGSFATRVSLVVGSLIGTGHTDVTATARVIGVSPKKLQRMLAAEGTTYGAVLEELRRKIALDLLVNSVPIRLSHTHTAHGGKPRPLGAFRLYI